MKSENRTDLGILWPIVIALILFATGVVNCQEKTPNKEPLHVTKHTGQIEQEDKVRLMTVTVTDKNGNLVYLYRDVGKVIEVTYLFWDEDSIVKTGDAKPPFIFKGCFLMAYCEEHKYIYWLQRTNCTKEKGPFVFKDQ